MSKPAEREFGVDYSPTSKSGEGADLVVNGKVPLVVEAGPTGNKSRWKTWSGKVARRNGANTIKLRGEGGGSQGQFVGRIEPPPPATN